MTTRQDAFSRAIAKLPTMAEVHAQRRATPKTGRVGAVAAPKTPKAKTPIKKARPEVAAAERRCRATVWKRDQARSRASLLPVVKGDPNELVRGEVAHLRSRSGTPAKKWDSSNCVLLTAEEHRLSDPRTAPGGKVQLLIKGTNARKALTFTRLAPDGTVLWKRISLPPKVTP